MGLVINLDEARTKRGKIVIPRLSSLTDYLKLVARLKQDIDIPDFQAELTIVDLTKLAGLFRKKLYIRIFEKRILTETAFLCGSYVSDLMTAISHTVPTSWYAMDYYRDGIEENKPYLLRDGADVCFLFCSLFQGRANHRSMTQECYETIGKGLYYHYYCKTQRPIGWYMGRNFSELTEVARESLQTLN